MSQSLEAKIVVLGSQGVGKTVRVFHLGGSLERVFSRSIPADFWSQSLVQRYVKNQFTPASTTSTVGASFLTKRVVDDESDTVVRLQIWDTAGQERFR